MLPLQCLQTGRDVDEASPQLGRDGGERFGRLGERVQGKGKADLRLRAPFGPEQLQARMPQGSRLPGGMLH